MAATVSYNALVNRLEKELTISVTTTEDPTRFKRKMSQAKHRMAIDGKLIFAEEKTGQEIEGQPVWCISVALSAKKSTVKILTMNENGGL